MSGQGSILRRYQAVNELIADIDRYSAVSIQSSPARRVSAIGSQARAQKSVAFTSPWLGTLFLLFIGVFAVAMVLQAQRITAERDLAQRERQRAQKVSNVALNVFSHR